MQHRFIFFTLLLCLISVLSACGQTGKLYLPAKNPQAETHEKS